MGAFLAWKSYWASNLIRHWAHEVAMIARHVVMKDKKTQFRSTLRNKYGCGELGEAQQ